LLDKTSLILFRCMLLYLLPGLAAPSNRRVADGKAGRHGRMPLSRIAWILRLDGALLIIELPFYNQSALGTAGSGSHPGTVLVEGRLLANPLGNSGNGVVFKTGDMSHQPKVVGLDVDFVAFTLDRQGRDVQPLACL
jgi:hypothetical protein